MNDVAIKMSGVEVAQNISPVVVRENPALVDILGRQEIVEQILLLLETLSEAQSSCAFALNGRWGSGKTFLLDMLETQLRDYQAGEKFVVLRYNCWQYDYYDEPLIAIVSAMIDNVNGYTQFFSGERREKIQAGFVSMAKEVMKKVAYSFIENKIGIDANNLSDLMETIQERASEELEEKNGYDNYYAFRKVIEEAKAELSKLAENQTLVIVVDELDRCLPDYSIKILERLHHLFAGLNNTIVIMAIDKAQLENTIEKTFGEKTNCDAYLRKFIDFELNMDVGKVNDSFFHKFSDYVALFDESALEPWTGIYDYIAALFSGIEVRQQEHLVKKVYMIHKLLFSSQEKKDFSFLCFELLMAVLAENMEPIRIEPLHYVEISYRANGYSDCKLKIEDNIPVPLASYIREHWIYQTGMCQSMDGRYPVYSGELDIPMLIIGYSELTYGTSGILVHRSEYNKYAEYIDDFKAIKRMLEIIK